MGSTKSRALYPRALMWSFLRLLLSGFPHIDTAGLAEPSAHPSLVRR
jgi:hypothetical protein